jgi:PAS domain S-box-containing protein
VDLNDLQLVLKTPLGQVFQRINQVFWVCSADMSETLYISPSYEQIWGRSTQSLYECPESFTDPICSEDRERVVAAVEGLLVGVEMDQEYRIIRPDSSIRWIHDRAFPVRDETGNVYCLAGIAEDITARKQAQEALKESEQAFSESEKRFRQIAENIDEVVWMFDPRANQILYINPVYEQLWGRTCQSLYERPLAWMEAIHPEDQGRVMAALEKRTTSGGEDIYRIVRPDGEIRWIRDRAFPVWDETGQVYQVIGVVEDITERKIAEEKLRKSEANLLSAQRIAHVGSWEFDVRSQQLTWSEEKLRIFGFDPTQPEPTYTQLVEMIHPDDRPIFNQAVTRALAEGTSYEIVFRIKRPSGQIRHIETRGEAIFNSAGQVVQLFGTVVDITERKQALEETLKALQRERELSEAKSRFIAMTSHDLRTPLTTIQSSVDLLKHHHLKLSEEKQQTHLVRISSAVGQMTSMVQDVLLLSEGEAGQLQFTPAPVDLGQMCRSLVADLQVADKNQHSLTFAASDECGTNPLLLDSKLVRYTLTNILSNALKYSPSGSAIHFDLTCNQDQVVFKIQDQGIGIPSEDVPRLFESFYRASNVGTTPGTGLGLAIIKQCVDLHGGNIAVDSVVGKGTTFTVTLPLSNSSQV